jgi:uncharacterized YccA/Bax inhibitor family protein
MNIDKEKVEVYKVLADIIQKLMLTIVFSIVFCVVIYFLLTSDPEWAKTAPLAAIELALAGTVYVMVKHFYPSN